MTRLDDPRDDAQVCRVLLVEDEPAARDGLAVLLEIEPDLVLCGTASSAEDALSRVAELEPDLVLLDNRLDGPVTGVELAPAIKQLVPSTTVLLCTAHPGSELQGRPGVDGLLSKADLVGLPEAVRQALGRA